MVNGFYGIFERLDSNSFYIMWVYSSYLQNKFLSVILYEEWYVTGISAQISHFPSFCNTLLFARIKSISWDNMFLKS